MLCFLKLSSQDVPRKPQAPFFLLFNHSLLLSYIWIATLDDESIAYFYFVYVYNFFLEKLILDSIHILHFKAVHYSVVLGFLEIIL